MIREFEFLADLDLSLITSRRTVCPFGLAGGHAGLAGINRLQRALDGITRELSPMAQEQVVPGDILSIETLGGGGFGEIEAAGPILIKKHMHLI